MKQIAEKKNTESMGKISVIIPIYNAENYLNRCLESIIQQTYKDLEVILIDDGSKDNSGKICDEYKNKDNRLIVIHKKNGGVCSARNVGLSIATGDYVCFMDADDFIDLDMYKRLINIIAKEEVDIVICGFANEILAGVFQPYCKEKMECVFNRYQMINNLLQNKYYSCSVNDKIFRKEIVNEQYFNENITHYEDLLYLYQVMKKCKSAVFVSDVYYYLFKI